MTETEKYIISKKDDIKLFIKYEVDNYNHSDTNIWGQLMDTILPEIHKFEKEVIFTFSSEFKDNPSYQIKHHFEMVKHVKDVREYYDHLIKNWLGNT